MEDVGDGAVDVVIKAFGRVSVDRATHGLPVRVVNRVSAATCLLRFIGHST